MFFFFALLAFLFVRAALCIEGSFEGEVFAFTNYSSRPNPIEFTGPTSFRGCTLNAYAGTRFYVHAPITCSDDTLLRFTGTAEAPILLQQSTPFALSATFTHLITVDTSSKIVFENVHIKNFSFRAAFIKIL